MRAVIVLSDCPSAICLSQAVDGVEEERICLSMYAKDMPSSDFQVAVLQMSGKTFAHAAWSMPYSVCSMPQPLV